MFKSGRSGALLVGLAMIGACGGDDAPAVDAAAITDAPVDGGIDAPDIDAPDIDAPDIDAPDIDAPVIDAPDIDAPDIDAPVIDAPVIDAPPVDAAVIDAAIIDAPLVDAAVDAAADAAIDAAPGDLRWLRTIKDLAGEQGRAGMQVVRATGDGMYVAGAFTEHLVLGAGQANQVTLHTPTPRTNTFLARYDRNGTFLWATEIGPFFSVITDAAVLADGAVAIVGTFAWDCVDTGPMPNPNPPTCNTVFGAGGPVQVTVAVTQLGVSPQDHGFVAVFEPSGTLRWVSWADADGYSMFEGVTALPDGSVIAAGGWYGITTYRGGTAPLTLGAANDGGATVVRFGADGTPLWARHDTGTCATHLTSVTSSPDGSSVVVGGRAWRASGDCILQLAAGAPTYPITVINDDHAVLASFAADGTPGWLLAFGNRWSDHNVYNLATTSDGDVIAVGNLAHGCNAPPPCGASFPSTSGAPLFVPQSGLSFAARYGFDGVRRWARPLGGQLRGSWTRPLGPTSDGGFAVTTQLYQSTQFGIGDPTAVVLAPLCPAGPSGDSVLARHAGDGSLTWFDRRVCTIGEGTAATTDAIVGVGRFYNNAVFGLGTSAEITVHAGPPPLQDEDLFITSQAP